MVKSGAAHPYCKEKEGQAYGTIFAGTLPAGGVSVRRFFDSGGRGAVHGGRQCAGYWHRQPRMANIATHLGKKAGLLVLAGDVIKTAVACWFCHQLAPELGLTALLYGGLGAVLGHNWPIWYKGRGGKGVAVTCAWLMLYLPVTGVLCCLAGGVAVLLTGYLPVGAVLIAALAVPVGWLQYGTEAGAVLALNAVIMVTRHWAGLQRIHRGEELQFFRPKL